MKILKHLLEQPFVAATGIAALVHSTWSLGTLFAGVQPDALGWQLLGWLVPALLIAFALDVGQIVTSAEIRQHGLSIGRGVTFVVFAAATYYLQWLYMAHHMPLLDIAPGVSDTARETAVSLRDAAIWFIPALLPLSTLLYTISSQHQEQQPDESPGPVPVLESEQPEQQPRESPVEQLDYDDDFRYRQLEAAESHHDFTVEEWLESKDWPELPAQPEQPPANFQQPSVPKNGSSADG